MEKRVDDLGFESYRRERLRRRASGGPAVLGQAGPEEARRCLQEADQNEIRDRQLTNEVQEFFEIATKKAADIVNQVAKSAQEKKAEQIASEMEDFLLDAFAHMQELVAASLQRRRQGMREERVEPSMHNLVGPLLDQFRAQGTAELSDKHLGQDPFRTDLDEVCREFRESTPELCKSEEIIKVDKTPMPLRAAKGRQEPQAETDVAAAAATAAPPEAAAPDRAEPSTVAASTATASTAAASTAAELPPADAAASIETPAIAEVPAAALATAGKAAAKAGAPEAEPVPGAAPPAPAKKITGEQARGLERLKATLRGLVEQGVMNRDEAMAAWDKRLASLGLM